MRYRKQTLCTVAHNRTDFYIIADFVISLLTLLYYLVFNYILGFLGRQLAWGFASRSRLSLWSILICNSKFMFSKVEKQQQTNQTPGKKKMVNSTHNEVNSRQK